MAITDVRIRRNIRLSQTLDDKGNTKWTGSTDLVIISDTANPSFSSIFANSAQWSNLGAPIPQLGDELTVSGITLRCVSRDLEYEKDNERVCVMTVRYEAPDDEPPNQDENKPQDTDAATWLRMTLSSENITKPAQGWSDLASVKGLRDADHGKTATNSAGDPVDGLEEDYSLVKLTYTNTQVANPNFFELLGHVNACNDVDFLGGAPYSVRVTGISAEYNQKEGIWSVSVEFMYKPDGWQIEFFDAGFNEIIDGKRTAILDTRGNPVSKPVPLNGAGNANPIGNEPYTRYLYPYPKTNLTQMFNVCRI